MAHSGKLAASKGRHEPGRPGSASGDRRSSGGYPLSVLFLVMATCGILLALAAYLPKVWYGGDVDQFRIFVASAVAAIALGFLGAVVSLYHHRRLRGLLLGSMLGALLGVICGPFVLIPSMETGRVLFISISGGITLLVIAAVLRLRSGRSHVPLREADGDVAGGGTE